MLRMVKYLAVIITGRMFFYAEYNTQDTYSRR